MMDDGFGKPADDLRSDNLDASLAQLLETAPFALIVTNLQGIIRRVSFPILRADGDARQKLEHRHITVPFREGDHTFVIEILQKLHHSESFSLECAPVWLHGGHHEPVYLSVSSLPVTRSENILVSWRIDRHNNGGNHNQPQRDRNLMQRIGMLEARSELQRRRVAQADRALQSAHNSNRILSNSLRSTREFQRHQSQTLKQMVSARDELIARSQDLNATAVEARVAADEARLRLRILADASWALTDLQNVGQTLQQLSDLLVPALTEFFAVDLVDTDANELTNALVSCRDKQVEERIQTLARCSLETLDTDHPLQNVLSTGHPTVLHGLQDGDDTWDSGRHTCLDYAAEAGLTACIIAPLRSRNRAIGTLTLGSTRPGHLYRPDDLQIAEDLALRTGQALDNALLFQDVVEATKDRERYLSMASHELRSPLAVVSGFGTLILRYINDPEPDSERIQMVGNEMQVGIERLQLLTDSLLASASVDAQENSLHRRQLDLAMVVRELADRTRVTLPQDQRARLEVTAESPVLGHWNLESIERAITNVVSNALKYSAPESQVNIDVKRAGNNAVITVRDHGIGMTDEELADLFTPFSRGKEARATAVGTGLGLYITRQIVRQHGGRVDVQSAPGEGSLVSITLPLDPAETVPPNT